MHSLDSPDLCVYGPGPSNMNNSTPTLKNEPKAGDRHGSIELRSSSIHGHGCFAIEDIPSNQPIIPYTGEYINGAEAMARDSAAHPLYSEYVMTVHDDLYIDGLRGGNMARFINHSCSPNVRLEVAGTEVHLVAERSIRTGEELTYDYEYNDPDRYPCNCGTASCRGYI